MLLHHGDSVAKVRTPTQSLGFQSSALRERVSLHFTVKALCLVSGGPKNAAAFFFSTFEKVVCLSTEPVKAENE